jgi:hypothetical protein
LAQGPGRQPDPENVRITASFYCGINGLDSFSAAMRHTLIRNAGVNSPVIRVRRPHASADGVFDASRKSFDPSQPGTMSA